jgi:hypothetical protein
MEVPGKEVEPGTSFQRRSSKMGLRENYRIQPKYDLFRLTKNMWKPSVQKTRLNILY